MSSQSPEPSSNRNLKGLKAYVAENRAKLTDEALTEALLKAGYAQGDIDAALAAQAADEASKPVRTRARNWVLAAYGIVYALLLIGMFTNPSASTYGASAIGAIGLTLTLGLALAIALALVRRSRGRGADPAAMAMTGLLAIPIILLVIVAGLCVATGLPIRLTPA